jgi:cytochrome c oxidase assembly protein subunit 11
MFGFGFLMIPLYDVFCEVTGLNGKFDLEAASIISPQTEAIAISSRQVTLQFTAAADDKDWQFKPAESELVINTGQQYQTHFSLHNPTNKRVEFSAVPSISPGLAAEYLIKTECFCFQKQSLQPGESVEMPLIFQLRKDIPMDYKKLTLAYRIYASAMNNYQ